MPGAPERARRSPGRAREAGGHPRSAVVGSVASVPLTVRSYCITYRRSCLHLCEYWLGIFSIRLHCVSDQPLVWKEGTTEGSKPWEHSPARSHSSPDRDEG